MNTGASAAIAMTVVLTGAFAIGAYSPYWAISTIRPSHRRAYMESREAARYWHTRTGLQEERGMVAVAG